MASSNYPFNQDTAFNSFVVTDDAIVQATLGRTYAQNELVPLNYPRLYKAFLAGGGISWFPVSQFVYISGSNHEADINDEATNLIQSGSFRRAYNALFEYWKDQLILNTSGWTEPLNAPLLVATPTDVKFFESSAAGGSFHLQINFDLVIFVKPDSVYA